MRSTSEWFLAVGMVASAAFYRPLTLWATNAWDLSSPVKLLVVGVVLSGVGVALTALVTAITGRVTAAATAVALVLMVLGHWQMFDVPVLAVVAAIAAGVIVRWFGTPFRRGVAILFIAVFGLAPLIQVSLAYLRKSDGYTIGELAGRDPVEATGRVEDVLVVIVDSYPALRIAADWFDHDVTRVTSSLLRRGYEVPDTAWSQFTFTALSVPSMMELQPIVGPGPTPPWGNLSPLYSIVRGESLVVASLRSAGFDYYHIESGWDGGTCGDVDVCMSSPWADEMVWTLAGSSILQGWMTNRFGSMDAHASFRVVKHLLELEDLFDDGQRDYIYAHLLLPHSPYVVDENCALHRGPEALQVNEAISDQLSCVDDFVAQIAGLAGDRTAVVITADHGPGTLGQIEKPATEWTNAEIAERLGIFLAYRLPEPCPRPAEPINLEVMRAIMACTVTIDLPLNHGRFLLGAEDPEWVDPERVAMIERQMREGTLRPGSL